MTEKKVRSTTSSQALEALRLALYDLPPAGPNGFEGLVATCVAELTGLQIRLAKSGSQFGRDASSPASAFTIAIEAKRYDGPLTLEALIGKAATAGFSLDTQLDLWVLCATVEIGDDTARKLAEYVDGQGFSILFLDWATRPLPPLAVLLGATATTTLGWLSDHVSVTASRRLKSCLSSIVGSAEFPELERSLKQELSSAHLGIGALRKRNRKILTARFSDKSRSRQAFAQFILPIESDRPMLKAGFPTEKPE